jgi:hypothetical protein
MRINGTTPDEIRWPAVEDYRPTTAVARDAEDSEGVLR